MVCSRFIRRSKDSWTILTVILVATCMFLWNYSWIPATKTEVPVILGGPLSSINVRQLQKEGDGGDNTISSDPVERHNRVALEAGDVPKNVPHATDGASVVEADDNNRVIDATASAPKAKPQAVPQAEPEKPVDKKPDTDEKKPEPAEKDEPAEKVEPVVKEEAAAAPAVTEKPKVITSGVPCPILQTCPPKQFSYYVKSGSGLNDPPIICYNNELIMGGDMKDKNYGRGANIVVIHPEFKTVMDRRTFDLYESVDHCMEMARYLSTYVPFKGQILLASYDDMTANLCKSVQKLLNQYGGSIIKELKFRENYVLVGEKALPGNFGFEKKEALNGKEWPATAVDVQGCANHPISPKYVDVDIINGYQLENCGVQKCGYDEIEMHVSTIADGKRRPKLCIGNSYIFYPGLKGGRGFNVVELDPMSKTVIKSAEYDTYQVESSRLELFLENVNPNNYLVVVVADDGSTSLKPHARELLKTFGFNGDLINMRTAMYFVGKKGMKMTPVQRVNQPEKAGQWPAAINERFCLPSELSEATAQQMSNKARTEFCAKHDSFADFCFVHHKTEPLIASEKIDKYDVINEVFDVPILVLGGVNNIAMSHTLQSLLKQPGLVKTNVHVAYSVMFGEDYKPFIELFGFKRIEIKPISKYVDFLKLAFDQFWYANPEAKYVIVIDDEIIAKTGFIWYMGHALQAMKKDASIGAASAWNPQGFTNVAADPSMVHVVSQFPGQAFLIPKTFYDSEIKDKEATCCSQRSIQQWFTKGTSKQYKYIVPEISRAGYFSSTAYSAQSQPLSNLAMSMPRTAASLNLTAVPLNMEEVVNFDQFVVDSLKSAYFTTEHDMTICKNRKDPGSAKLLAPFLPADKKVIGVVYNQAKEDDFTSLKSLYSCFGLMYMEGINPYGLYNGVTTISMDNRRVHLIGTSSQFYKSTVQSIQPSPYVLSF